MGNRFCRILSLILCMIMTMPALCAGTASAEEHYAAFLGKPFPDFIATDTERNIFTLSGALKNHEAVLINLWATWCGYCRQEFPFLNEAYQKYGKSVAFIALSTEPRNTIEVIEAYRKELGLTFAMGRDEGRKLSQYISGDGIPVTVIVDRFGNAVFYQCGAFSDSKQVERVLDKFLGDGYTKTAVLYDIPADSSTQAFPVSAMRALYPESGNYRKVTLKVEGMDRAINGWIVPDDTSVRLRAEIAADDNVYGMVFLDVFAGKTIRVTDLLDPERGVYVYDLAMPDKTDEYQFTYAWLYDTMNETDSKQLQIILFRDEAAIDRLIQIAKESGEVREVSWAYAEEARNHENTLKAYIIHVADQDGRPVEGVSVSFCTDSTCVPKESDESGTITFTGAPEIYHVQIIDAPDGYSWDENYEMYTTREYGEWVLRIRKN